MSGWGYACEDYVYSELEEVTDLIYLSGALSGEAAADCYDAYISVG